MCKVAFCILLYSFLFGFGGGVQYWQQEHPGKDKRHHYRLAKRHSGGFSDEWLGSCQHRYILDYDKVPIRDPDPRIETHSDVEMTMNTNNTGIITEDHKQDRKKEPQAHLSESVVEAGIENSSEKQRQEQGKRHRYRGKRSLVEEEKREWESQTWFKKSKALPFKRREGDESGLKVLIVTIDNRALKSKRRDKDTESIDNTAIINEHYAAKHGYDYLYVKTSEPGGGSKVGSNDSVCSITRERFNCSSFLKIQCPKGGKKGKYEIATYHVGRGYGRASSWNKLPPLIYLSSEYGHLYNYFLFLDSDVMLNARYHHLSLSDKINSWQNGKSNISPQLDNLVWGQKEDYIHKLSMARRLALRRNIYV